MALQRWQAAIPLGPAFRFQFNDGPETPFEIRPDISLEYTPQWLRKQADWGSSEIDEYVSGSQYSLVTTYHSEKEEQAVMGERLRRAAIMLWLAGPTDVQWRLCAHGKQEGGNFVVRFWEKVDAAQPHLSYQYRKLKVSDLELARRLAGSLANIEEGAVWTAMKTLFMAVQQTWWEGRFLMFWVGLEALFSPDSEVSFRVCLRMAKFLKGDSKKVPSLFKRLRTSYDIRSKVAHGQPLKKVGGWYSARILIHVELLLRDCLRKIALDQAAMSAFQSERRNAYLDGLCVGGTLTNRFSGSRKNQRSSKRRGS